MRKAITYPCIYTLCAGMPCGPILIPEEHKISEETVINYTLELMKTYIKGRASICWDKNGNKKPTQFWRDKDGKPYCEK